MRNQSSAGQLTREATAFALAHEADGFGVTPMNQLYVFEGYRIDEPRVIMLALAHDDERLKHVPSDETNGVGLADVGDCYSRGTRASHALANWICSQGYNANAYRGPSASAPKRSGVMTCLSQNRRRSRTGHSSGDAISSR